MRLIKSLTFHIHSTQSAVKFTFLTFHRAVSKNKNSVNDDQPGPGPFGMQGAWHSAKMPPP